MYREHHLPNPQLGLPRIAFIEFIRKRYISIISDIDAASIDKLSQWTGERFFKEGKTELSREFVEYEKDIELRKKGIERLHATSIPYHANISKKKRSADPYPADDTNGKEEIFVGEALGLVMISHGQDMSRNGVGDRQYAERLEKFGRARCKIAMIQDEYAGRIGDGYILGMENALNIVQDYQALRKKLDSRRLALDAATRKLNASKKDSRALEDEVESAQARFEEIQEDVMARMATVQESEAALVTELSDLLEAELDFANQYQTILLDLKKEWGNGAKPDTNRPRSKSTSAVPKASLPRTLSVPKISSPAKRPGLLPSRQSSFQQNESEEDEKKQNGSKNRERSQSNVSAGSRTKSFIGSFGAFGKKDKNASSQAERRFPTMKQYGSLNDDDDAPQHSLRRRDTELSDASDDQEPDLHGELDKFSSHGRDRSYSNTTKMDHVPVRLVSKSRTPIRSNAHHVRVLFEYSGNAADELTMQTGDIITVTKEVSPDWWIGENALGQSGLFPSAYTEYHDAVTDDNGDNFDYDDDDTEELEDEPTTTANIPPPLPSVARPRALPPRVSSVYASSTSRLDAPTSTRASDSGAGTDSSRSLINSRPALSASNRLTSSTSAASPGKKAPPPLPPTRRMTQTGGTVSSTGTNSPVDSPFESPIENGGPVHRMVMPAGLGVPLASKKASYTGSPFGGSDDEHGVTDSTRSRATVSQCMTCGCDE
ncbi:hypothetical protein NliqN6_0647 [Naganishia liquefaciens]|uniref:SH3 domain-containing protein n=1 Tax=Naganishia liquefaciens TaxID=104408 RepID=A0A8H3TNC2_9TREE|nr:hypothetical protein NliqN6_0647 [Naganishia liquefaciens]